jgi:hypothetical protein
VRQIAGLIGDLDALEASRRLAREIDAHLPVLAPPGRLRLVAARHPCSTRGSPGAGSGCSARAATRARSSHWRSSSHRLGERW